MGRASMYSGGPVRDGKHDKDRQEPVCETCRQWCSDHAHYVVHVLYAAGTEGTVIEDRWACTYDVVADGADLVMTWNLSTWDMGWSLPDVGTYSWIVNGGIPSCGSPSRRSCARSSVLGIGTMHTVRWLNHAVEAAAMGTTTTDNGGG